MKLFSRQSPIASALAIFMVAFAAIAGAWGFQYEGYIPCDLCYAQRYAYYAGVPLAWAVAIAAVMHAPRRLLDVGFALLAAMFLANAALALYHSGVEAKVFEGPTACSGAAPGAASGADLLKQLETIKVVRCDEPALRVFGLSLANWNLLISLALAGAAAASVLRRGRPRAA